MTEPTSTAKHVASPLARQTLLDSEPDPPCRRRASDQALALGAGREDRRPLDHGPRRGRDPSRSWTNCAS